MKPEEIKRLEMIQAIIARMAQNSFVIKGWAVTLSAALLALNARGADLSFAVLAVFPAVVFCGMDAYYLSLERQFRATYNTLAPSDMKVSERAPAGKPTWLSALVAPVVFLPYLTIVVVVVLIATRFFQQVPGR